MINSRPIIIPIRESFKFTSTTGRTKVHDDGKEDDDEFVFEARWWWCGWWRWCGLAEGVQAVVIIIFVILFSLLIPVHLRKEIEVSQVILQEDELYYYVMLVGCIIIKIRKVQFLLWWWWTEDSLNDCMCFWERVRIRERDSHNLKGRECACLCVV